MKALVMQFPAKETMISERMSKELATKSWLLFSKQTLTILAFQHLVDQYFPGTILDQAFTLQSSIKKVKEVHYNLVIVDDTFSDKVMLNCISELSDKAAKSRILVYSGSAKLLRGRDMAGMGINGFIDKKSPLNSIVNSIRNILSEKRESSNGLVSSTDGMEEQIVSAIKDLTTVELTILSLLLKGIRQQDIAKMLGKTGGTIVYHRKNLMEKLGVKDLISLGLMAHKFEHELEHFIPN
jgi:DNA-binding NarL/FixJ family response regulator